MSQGLDSNGVAAPNEPQYVAAIFEKITGENLLLDVAPEILDEIESHLIQGGQVFSFVDALGDRYTFNGTIGSIQALTAERADTIRKQIAEAKAQRERDLERNRTSRDRGQLINVGR